MVLFEVVNEIETSSGSIEGLPDYASGSNFEASVNFVGSVISKSFDFLSNNYIVGNVSILDFIIAALLLMFVISFFLIGYKRRSN